MRINAINIEDFADGEHRGLEERGFDGESVILEGGSRTGKTLTFNAVLYGLLGAKETIDLSTGRSNRVTLAFDNGVTFTRGNPQAVYDDGDVHLESDDAQEAFSQELEHETLIKSHFIHSHIGQLPLDNLSKEDRISVIRTVTNQEVEAKLQRFRSAEGHLSELVQECEDAERRYEEQLADIERQIDQAQRQLEKFEELQSKIQSGEIERIRSRLQENQELEARLDELFERQEGIRQQLRRLRRQKRKQENYAEEVRTVIAEAVNDFVCPTCDRRITTEKAERRIQRGYCPYCGREHDLEELKENIGEKIERSDELLEEFEEEIEQLIEERQEIQEEIEAIQEEQPELSDLDGFTKRKLNESDYDIEHLRAEVEREIQELEETIAELRDEQDGVETELKSYSNSLESYREALEDTREAIEELETESFEADIEAFTDRWEDVYQQMSPTIGLQIHVTEEGDVQLPGRNTLREYDRGGDLSDSEVRLLNLSFAYTLNQFANENEVAEWNTFVLDEVFDSLDSSSRQEAVEFVAGADEQFIVTTSDDQLRERFDTNKIVTLESDPIQTQISDFA